MYEGRDPTSAPGSTAAGPSVARLCDTYDALLGDDARAAEGPRPDLAAMARIYDIPTDRAAKAVWSDLRAVLVRQPVRTDEPGDDTTAAARAEGSGLTVLVVEDDADMAQDLVAALVEAGHRVIGPFHSAEAAEVSAGHHAIDVALLDLNLSGAGTGADLAESLRTRWGVGSIFLSGDVTAAARHARLAHTILVKPYRARDVLEAITRAASTM